MTSVKTPPITNNIIDSNGRTTIPWVLFFQSIQKGDVGTIWQPSFTSLTQAGGDASISGRYYQITTQLCYFRITITPVSSTSSTAGTTYCDNLPLSVNAAGVCAAVYGNVGGTLGTVRMNDGRIYTPTWTTISTPVTVIGLVEAS